MSKATEATTVPIANSIRQLKRRKWHEIAYRAADFHTQDWFYHVSPKDMEKIKALHEKGLIYLAQKRIDYGDYRLLAQTSLEYERAK